MGIVASKPTIFIAQIHPHKAFSSVYYDFSSALHLSPVLQLCPKYPYSQISQPFIFSVFYSPLNGTQVPLKPIDKI